MLHCFPTVCLFVRTSKTVALVTKIVGNFHLSFLLWDQKTGMKNKEFLPLRLAVSSINEQILKIRNLTHSSNSLLSAWRWRDSSVRSKKSWLASIRWSIPWSILWGDKSMWRKNPGLFLENCQLFLDRGFLKRLSRCTINIYFQG